MEQTTATWRPTEASGWLEAGWRWVVQLVGGWTQRRCSVPSEPEPADDSFLFWRQG